MQIWGGKLQKCDNPEKNDEAMNEESISAQWNKYYTMNR